MGTEVGIVSTETDKEALFAFRYRIYVEEMGLSPEEADHKHQWLSDELDEISINYTLKNEGKLVGALRVTPFSKVENPQAMIDKFQLQPAIEYFGAEAIATTSRFMLDPNVRHGRTIFKMMKKSFIDSFLLGYRLNYGDCSPSLIPFYEHMGYRRYTRAYNDSNYGYKIPILMLIRDHDWFQRVRSLFLRTAKDYPDDYQARAWFEKTYPEFIDVESAAMLPEGAFFNMLQEKIGTNNWHKLPIFMGLNQDETKLFLNNSVLIHTATDDKIIHQGEKDATLYILLKGVAEVIKDEEPTVPIHVVGVGEVFGEIGFLTDIERTANVVACAPSEVLALSSESLERFLHKNPTVAAKVLLNLSRMLASNLANCK